MCSVAGRSGAGIVIFITSGFHRLFAAKPVRSETSKAERWSSGDHERVCVREFGRLQ